MPLEQLKKTVRAGQVLDALRISFWVEYNRAIMNNHDRMIMERVFAGICTDEYFYSTVVKTVQYLAWMLTPPIHYQVMLEQLLQATTSRLHELVNLPFYDEDKKKVDHKTAALILKAHEMVENRLKGMPVARSQNVNVGVNVRAGSLASGTQQLIETELQQRLKELQKRERNLIKGYSVSDPSTIDNVPDTVAGDAITKTD